MRNTATPATVLLPQLLAAVVLAACGSSGGGPALPDVSVDAADTRPDGTLDAADAVTGVDADAPDTGNETTAADTADDTAGLAAPCPELDGVTPTLDGAVACDGLTVLLRAVGEPAEGLLRIDHVPVGATLVESSYAMPDVAPGARLAGVETEAGARVLCNEAWRVEVDEACRLRVSRVAPGSEPVLVHDEWIEGGGFAVGTGTVDGAPAPYVRVTSALAGNAAILGFGEHTGPLDRVGTDTTYWNTDAYNSDYGGYAPDADPLYASLPLGTRVLDRDAWSAGPGHVRELIDHPWRLEADFGTDGEHIVWTGYGPTLTRYLGARYGAYPSLRHHRLDGLLADLPQPPVWAFGFHQSRWGYDDAQTVLDVARGFRERSLPLDVIWLDIQHMDGFRTFTFDPVRFADPEGLLASLHDLDVHVVAIADPGIKVDDGWALYADARDERLFLQDARGADVVASVWPGPSSFPDFGLPLARAWWADQIAALARRGVDGVWLDVNEPTTFPEGGAGLSVPNESVVRGLGREVTMAEFHNVYALHQVRATVDGLRQARPGEAPFVLTRAGYPGVGALAGMWTGDVPSTWWGLQQSLPMMVNLSLSGVPFVGTDVGGYSGNASPELYARWMALGVVSPFFRAHQTRDVPGAEPWMFGQEVLDLSRALLRQRMELLPTLIAPFLTGAPPVLLGPYAVTEPDGRVVFLEDQAMLGDSLMVAPVLEEGARTRSVRLAAGSAWYEWRTGRRYEGGQTIEVQAPLAALPMFVREGGCIARWPARHHVNDGAPAWLQLDAYVGASGASCFAPWRVSDAGMHSTAGVVLAAEGDVLLALIDVDEGDEAEAGYDAPGELRIRLPDRGAPPTAVEWLGVPEGEAVALEQGSEAARGPRWWYDATDRSVWLATDPCADCQFVVALPPTDADGATIPMTFRVEVPEGTPSDVPIHIAGTFTDWAHQPLTWEDAGRVAVGTFDVPRGDWFYFKYTRGSWETVEKYPACEEANDRYAFGEAAERVDTVWNWRDWCEGE